MWGKYKLTKKEVLRLWELTKPNGKRLYTKKEIGKIVGVGEDTVARWLDEEGVEKMIKYKAKLPIDNR